MECAAGPSIMLDWTARIAYTGTGQATRGFSRCGMRQPADGSTLLKRTRVILADDHLIVAEGLGRLIAEVAELVDCVSNGRQLVESARRLLPDVIISDITMPQLSGLDAMRLLKSEGLRARFIFLTIHSDPYLAAGAIRDGASAYLLKQAAGEELVTALRTAEEGRVYLTPIISANVLKAMANPARGTSSLTPRQFEILRLIVEGKRMKEIAGDLGISVRTVEEHKANLVTMLGANGTADLVRVAIRQGLIPP
jgi:two-component system, NarL family, response regulator NreC